jgi:hypothetical protein
MQLWLAGCQQELHHLLPKAKRFSNVSRVSLYKNNKNNLPIL